MESVMNHWKADQLGVFTAPGLFMGNLLLKLSPGREQEILPFTSGRYTICGDIRLDNREEITKKLGGSNRSGENRSDASLLLEFFAISGPKVVRLLVGDFAFVIWDAQDQTLFCARDHLGVRPFYYYYRNNIFAFASEKKGILCLPEVNQSLDEDYCLRLLADLDTPSDRTFFQHIHQIPAAHFMTVTRDGCRKERYWKLEMPPLLKLKDPEDYYEGFREQFETAVEARIHTPFPIGVELSGGLDSAAVLGTASRLILDKNQLHTFSNIAPVDASGRKNARDEEEWIDQAIAFNDIRFAHKQQSGGWSNIFEPHDLELEVHGSPMPYSSSWMEPIRHSMEDAGIRIALSGYCGDEFITNQGENYFYDIFYEKDYRAFIKACMAEQIPLMPIKMLFRKTLPSFGLNPFPRDKKREVARCSVMQDKQLEDQLLKTSLRTEFPKSITRSHKQMIIEIISRPSVSYRFESEAGYAIRHRVETRYPLADIRLLRYFLSVPAKLIGEAGMNRAFFRHAMKGLIPDPIRWRMDKSVPASPFSAIEADGRMRGYHSWLGEMGEYFKKGILSQVDYLELVRRFDPGVKENYVDGLMRPKVNFHTLSMIRFKQN